MAAQAESQRANTMFLMATPFYWYGSPLLDNPLHLSKDILTFFVVLERLCQIAARNITIFPLPEVYAVVRRERRHHQRLVCAI